MPDGNTVWRRFPELVDQLKELFATHSSSVIAAKLGHGLSRNAIIGKCTRLGLKRPSMRNETTTMQRVVRRKRERITVDKFHPATSYTETLDMTPVPSDTEIPLAQRKTVLTIGMYDCRFGIGDPTQPDFFFCGAPKLEHSPYCRHHTERCFAKPVPRTTPQYGFRR